MAYQHTQHSQPTPIINNCHLKVMYWNIRGINSHREDIELALQDTDIFVGVETKLNPNDTRPYKFPGFHTHRVDRPEHQGGQGGGIIFLVKNHLSFKSHQNINNPHPTTELAGIEINNVKPIINLLACYRNPAQSLDLEHWTEIINIYQGLENCILVGDFNAHHVAWNCHKITPDGQKLYDCIEKNNIFLHNTDTYTHIDTYRGIKSNIDLVMSCPSIADITTVTAIDETWGSDHYPLNITISVHKTQYIKRSFKLTSVRTDWDKLNNILTSSFASFITPSFENLNTIEKYRFFIDNIETSVAEMHATQKNSSTQNASKCSQALGSRMCQGNQAAESCL